VLITNHVAQGAVIGAVAPGPVSAFTAGIASHFAADAVPHWGVQEYDDFLRVAFVDGLVGLATMALLTRTTSSRRRLSVFAGMLGACLPDSDKPSKLFFDRSPFPRVVDRWHAAIQTEEPQRMGQEVVCAAATLLIASWLIRRR
jgi:hypothetical protein